MLIIKLEQRFPTLIREDFAKVQKILRTAKFSPHKCEKYVQQKFPTFPTSSKSTTYKIFHHVVKMRWLI